MSTPLLAVLMMLAPVVSPDLFNTGEVVTSRQNDPGKIEIQGWAGFQVPALAGTSASCCWSGRWRGPRHLGCSLQDSHNSFGTFDGSPLTNQLTVLVNLDGRRVRSLMVVGDGCPVDANGENLTWLETVNETDGLNWLEQVAVDQGQNDADKHALQALAGHAAEAAGERLYGLARHGSGNLAEDAVFWLGHARGEDGYQWLYRLLNELPQGDTRRHINFALTQNDQDRAGDLLLDIALHDSDLEQRADALFWLAETRHPGAMDALTDAISSTSETIREHALHGLAQFGTIDAANALTDTGSNHPDPETRGQALFWLAREYPERAEPILMARIQIETNTDALHQAVFAVSQLPDESATRLLLELARGDYSPVTRKQAIFWLAQSDDDQAVEALVSLLTRQ